MAKKRRKIDKIRAKERLIRNLQQAPLPKVSIKTLDNQEKNGDQLLENKIVHLFNYEPKFIKNDLRKTALVTLVVLLVLALINLRYT